jgi:hypothetical protein
VRARTTLNRSAILLWRAPYAIRNVRIAASSPQLQVLRDAGAPMDPETGQMPQNATIWVVHFPVQAPAGAITRRERTAVQQCKYWLQNKLHWTEHNPSVTITYQAEDVPALMEWLWAHRHQIGGMTFLPVSEARYAQPPYLEITRAEYTQRVAVFPVIDFSASIGMRPTIRQRRRGSRRARVGCASLTHSAAICLTAIGSWAANERASEYVVTTAQRHPSSVCALARQSGQHQHWQRASGRRGGIRC